MKLIKMSYKGLNFSVNPATITIDYSKKISTKHIPFSVSRAQEVTQNPTKITGKGKYVGEDARSFARSLERVFKKTGSAYLFIPDGLPIKAFFTALNISYDAKDSAVSYSFEFVEDYNGKRDTYDFGYTMALDGENLYDISNRTGVDVATIFGCNNYKDLFSVKGGDRVWLN